jgi:hypothetical protein
VVEGSREEHGDAEKTYGEKMHVEAAGDTVIPAILLIRQMGYTITYDKENGHCLASKDGNSFGADDPLTVLGLIKLFEMKGENWKVSDNEIDEVLREIS